MKQRKTQTCGAGRRDERQRLAGDGRGRQTGGRCSAPGEEVRSGCTDRCYNGERPMV